MCAKENLAATKCMIERIKCDPKIKILTGTKAIKIIGDGNIVTRVELEDVKTKKRFTENVAGVFVA